MIIGLKEGQPKGAKSDPDSAIFMEDTAEVVERKIKKAFCPVKVIEGNPMVEYARYIILPAFDFEWLIERRLENGEFENRIYRSYEQFEADYANGVLHPADLKPAIIKAINKLLQPVRDHFANDPYARSLKEKADRWVEE